jgi:predicted DNA-binding protein
MPRRDDNVQYLLKLPLDMRARMQKRADQAGRSLSAEILAAIEAHLKRPSIFDRVTRIEERLGL